MKIKCSVICMFFCSMYLVNSTGDSQRDCNGKEHLAHDLRIFGAIVPPTGKFLNIPLSKKWKRALPFKKKNVENVIPEEWGQKIIYRNTKSITMLYFIIFVSWVYRMQKHSIQFRHSEVSMLSLYCHTRLLNPHCYFLYLVSTPFRHCPYRMCTCIVMLFILIRSPNIKKVFIMH